ncbi:MAG: extracellular solute-binding protein [Treponema sp.]|nr:extracellular solute-binding protein [Treponema sp.]
MKRQKMPTLFAAAVCLSIAAFGLASCEKAKKSVAPIPTVTIWGTGGQEVRESLEEIASAFNADSRYNQKARVEIQFIVSGTSEQSLNDRLSAAYKADQTDTDFDLLAIDDSMISAIMGQTGADMFDPIDTAKIPNYNNLLFKPVVGKGIFVPYRGTAVYLAYNSAVVPNPPKTDQELYRWIREHPGRFSYNIPLTGGSGLSFAVTAVYNRLPEEAALSGDTIWRDNYKTEWDEGIALLQELHPYLYKTAGRVQYPNKNAGTLTLLANQEIDMCPAYVNMVLEQKSMGVLPQSIEIVQISPAFSGALAGFCMPSIGGDKEAAYLVMDYFLSPEAQAIAWNGMYAFPLIALSTLKNLENAAWLNAAEFSEIRYFSIGMLLYEIGQRWEAEVGVLAR